MKMEIINEKGNKPEKELYKCIRKSKDYGFSMLDFRKKNSESGSKNEKGRRNDKEASIGDRNALEVKGGRVIKHVSLLDFCKTSFCRRRRPY
jgi:hypothetical protein